MRLLPYFVALLSLTALFFSFTPNVVEANSLGYGIPCDIANPTLGSDNLQKPGANDPVRAMWWTKKPAFAGNKYTLRTADSGTADPTSYVPGQWTELYLRANEEDRQFTGLLMYAENAQGTKVGEWFIPPRQEFRVDPTSGCVTHKNADKKNYLSTFRVKFPKGTGTVTIKALVKYGLAFPALEGLFLWPNKDAHLQLTEAPSQTTAWYQGTVGQSCNTVCRNAGLGCDVNAMKTALANPASWYDTAKKFTQCTLPLLKGCSGATPSVGENGCYYHVDTCTRSPAYPAWERADPCDGLPDYKANTNYDKVFVKYGGFKWYANYYTSETPNDRQYGPWSKRSACMPVGGYPTDAPPQTPAPRASAQIDCAAILSSPLDGNRICACSGNPSAGTDPPTQAPPTTKAPVVTTSTQATFAPGYQACGTPLSITVTSNGLAYQFSHIPGVDNPPLELVIGRTYSFVLDASINGGNHPFAIKTKPGTGNGDLVATGVTNNNVKVGTVTFTPATGSTLSYYQCSVHSIMVNTIGFTDEGKCAATTQPPATTPATTTKPPVTQPATTTTPSPNPCDGIDCGANGMCSFGMCKCTNGYTGIRCETAPAVKCNIDCKGLNRGTCVSDNQCGACLAGFKLSGVNCVVECDTGVCDMLNRQTCIAPNTCGGCQADFVEPTANNRNTGLMCQSAAAPPPTNTPPTANGYKFEIGSQWQSGFCGTVSGPFTYTGDESFNIQFQVPAGLTMTASWNLGASYDSATGIVTGRLPEWVKHGTSFSGGFCATFQYNPDMLIQTNSIGFTKAIRSAQSKASLQAISEYEVDISVKLNQTSMSDIDNNVNFVPNLKSEVAKLIGVMPSQVNFLRYDPVSATDTKVSFAVLCSNPDQISLTSSFTENLRQLQATTGDKNNPQRATEYVALYPTLSKADSKTVAMSYPTQLYTDNTAAESASSAYSNKTSFSIVALATAAAMLISRW